MFAAAFTVIVALPSFFELILSVLPDIDDVATDVSLEVLDRLPAPGFMIDALTDEFIHTSPLEGLI